MPPSDEAMAPWEAYARRTLALTEYELSLSVSEWERVYAIPHPGEGYTLALQARHKRLRRELELYGEGPSEE